MSKKHFHWGWIPLLAMLVLPIPLLFLAFITQDDTMVGFQNYMRLFLKDELFLVALRNTCLPPLMAGALVAAVALTVKKCVWDGQNRPHSQGWFYGVTSVVMGLAMLAVQQSSALIAQLVGYPSADYAAHTLMQHLMDYSSAPHTGMSGTGGIVLWFIAILLLLLVYIADRFIPARKQPAVTGFGRGFSVAHFLLHLCFGTIFGVALVRSFFFTFSKITTDGLEFHADALWKQDQPLLMVLYACGVVAVILLLIAELVFGAWFMVKGSHWSGIAVVTTSVVVMLSMWLIPQQALLTPLYLMLRSGLGLGINLVDTPMTVLTNYRLFHLLALLCCATAVWLRWPRTTQPPTVSETTE